MTIPGELDVRALVARVQNAEWNGQDEADRVAAEVVEQLDDVIVNLRHALAVAVVVAGGSLVLPSEATATVPRDTQVYATPDRPGRGDVTLTAHSPGSAPTASPSTTAPPASPSTADPSATSTRRRRTPPP